MPNSDPTVVYTVNIPLSLTEELQGFLQEHGVEFDPRAQATHFNDSGSDPRVRLGHEAPGMIRAVNGFLEQYGIKPLMPGDPGEWSLAALHDFLELANGHFNWDPAGRHVTDAPWRDEGQSWRDDVAASFPSVFRAQTG